MSLLDAFIEEFTIPPPTLSASNPNLTREISVAIRTDGAAGSGTPSDPYNGRTQALLDELLSDIQDPNPRVNKNMTVRFGPGVIQTRGVGAIEGFQVLSGQRFVGSGMYQTTLQIVKATVIPPFTDVTAFDALASVEDIEFSDMTLDCNLLRQSKNSNGLTALIAKAVGFSSASRVRLRRVRIINWGTHTQFDPAVPDASKECFPIFIVSKADGGHGEAKRRTRSRFRLNSPFNARSYTIATRDILFCMCIPKDQLQEVMVWMGRPDPESIFTVNSWDLLDFGRWYPQRSFRMWPFRNRRAPDCFNTPLRVKRIKRQDREDREGRCLEGRNTSTRQANRAREENWKLSRRTNLSLAFLIPRLQFRMVEDNPVQANGVHHFPLQVRIESL